jgi:Bacterial PH domain
MKAVHEHEWEAQPGLPEALPANERILWQGQPLVASLAIHAFHIRKVALYFLVMWAWQAVVLLDDHVDRRLVVEQLMVSTVLIAVALLSLWGAAWWSAKTTLYTITDRRVVMRIGIVLSVTFNLPFRQIKAAHLKPCSTGSGDIAIELSPSARIGWFHLWPHQRAWHLKHPQPTMRSLANADQVSQTLGMAWHRCQERSTLERRAPERAPVDLQEVAA